jgi:hypothetical protein
VLPPMGHDTAFVVEGNPLDERLVEGRSMCLSLLGSPDGLPWEVSVKSFEGAWATQSE